MKIESEKDNTSLLSLFLFTVQEYEAITAHILLRHQMTILQFPIRSVFVIQL